MSQLMTYHDRRKGFTIQFDGTDEKLTFSWQEVLDRCEDVYFFGPPVNGARRYEKLFYHKTRVSYLQHVFQNLARETVGDVYSSMALALAFQDALVLAQQKRLVKPAPKAATDLIDFNETEKSALFFSLFDELCRH